MTRAIAGAATTSRLHATYATAVAAITAGGLLARLLLLDHQPLWRDEAFTAVAIRRPLLGTLDAVRHDSAPPLAYLLDHIVATVSTSPAALRLLPAVAGTAAVPLGAALGRRAGGERAGLWAAAVCAVSPALVMSSRDARMYSLAAAAVIAGTLLLWRALERPGWSRWSLYCGAMAIAMYTQYFAAFALVAQLVAAAVILRPPRRMMLTAAACAGLSALLLVPWLIAAGPQLSHGSTPFWVQSVGAKTLSGVVVQFFSGPPVDQGVPDRLALQVMQSLAVGAGGMAAYALLRRRALLSPDQRRGAAFLGACGLGALLLFVIASVWHPLVEARYVSVVWGPLLPLLGAGLALLPWRALAGFALGCLAATSAALASAMLHPDSPAVAAELHGSLGAHDIVASSPSMYLLVLYYGDPDTVDRAHIIANDVPWYWGTATYPPGAVIPAVPADVTDHRGTIVNVFEPGDAFRWSPPPSYGLDERHCDVGVCVERLRPRGS